MRIVLETRRCAALTDDALWETLSTLANGERKDLTRFLIHLAEVKRRDLHVKRAYPGLYHYLLALGFSEWEARARALAAGAAMKYRAIYALLASGRMTLSGLSLVVPYLTPDNHRLLLRKACRRTTRELRVLIAGISPRAARRDVLRVVSAPSPIAPASAPAATSTAAQGEAFPSDSLFPGAALSRFERRPTGETRLRHSFDCSEELQEKIQRAKELLSNKYPSGRLEFILSDALEALLDRIDPQRRFARRVVRIRKQAMKGVGMAGSA